MRHHLPRSLRALSLVETVIAVFLLTAQILWLSVASQSYVQNQRDVAKRERACFLANQKLEEIRLWAKSLSNFSSNWSAFDNTNQVDTSDPSFQTSVRCQPGQPQLFSPCAGLESPWASQAKLFTHSLVGVHVSVRWRAGDPNAQYSSSIWIAEPPHPGPYTVTLASGAASLAPLASATFQAKLLDRDGNAVEDLQWQWRVVPISGNGTVFADQDRSQRQVRLLHAFWRYGLQVSIPGTVRLEARTRYQGQDLSAQTSDVVLQP